MGRCGAWMIASLALTACLPAATTRDGGSVRICTSNTPCPFYLCICDGGTYNASRCTESCSDEAATCTSLCSDGSGGLPPQAGPEPRIWAVTLAVGLGEFLAVGSTDRRAREAAVLQCTRASVQPGQCAGGNSALTLEAEGESLVCDGSFSLGQETFSYASGGLTRTQANASVIDVCINTKDLPGPSCGLGQFACHPPP